MGEAPIRHLRSVEYVPGVGLVAGPGNKFDRIADEYLRGVTGRGLADHRADIDNVIVDHLNRAADDDHDDYVTAFLAAEHDDDGPSDAPRVVGHRDAGGTHSLEPRGQLRRGRMDWLKRLGVPGFTRDQRPQLVNGGRLESSAWCRSGVTGLADHGGDADTERRAGSVGLRSLVGRFGRWS